MNKLLLALLLVSSSAIAGTSTEKTPYLKVGTNETGTIDVYVGALNGFEPTINKNGIVIVRELFIQAVAENGSPLGAGEEDIMAVMCDAQTMKTIAVSKRNDLYSETVDLFKNSDDVTKALNILPFEPLKPNTISAFVVDIGCAYVRKQSAPKAKPKLPDINT